MKAYLDQPYEKRKFDCDKVKSKFPSKVPVIMFKVEKVSGA